MRVLVADDHSLFRDGLTSLLTAAGIEVVGEVGDGEQAVKKALKLKPDIVLMDLNMPVMNGLEALHQLRTVSPETKVVMLTVSDRSEDLISAIEAGADGYLLKSLDSQSFIASLRSLEHGGAAITGEMASRLMAHMAQRAKESKSINEPRPALSAREVGIVRLIANGLSNKDIAQELKISENTVKYHLKHILRKLNLKNRAEAAAYAVQSGFVTPRSK